MLVGLVARQRHAGPGLDAWSVQGGTQGFHVRLGVVVQAQSDLLALGVVQEDQTHAVLADALHRDEAAQLEPVAHQALAVADERDGAGHAAHPQWHDQAPALPELMRPRRGMSAACTVTMTRSKGACSGRRALRRR
ncbi:hypothetical protein [Streptomyces sp. C8S0]|uniref:hypothetical protein n=1 Tax=Streptomyces sp. C8S0 TaxID=2585716 RepID=UPI001D03FDFC|nr:hypothetical protein [Streptomyces sp. C8S0]